MGACVSCDGRRAALASAVYCAAGGGSRTDAWIVPTYPLDRRYDVEAMHLALPELGPKCVPCATVFALDPLSSSPTVIRRLGLVQRCDAAARGPDRARTRPLTVVNASGRVLGWDAGAAGAAEGSVDALAGYLADAAAAELGPDIERVDVYVRTNLDVEYRCRGVLGLRRALRGALPTVLCARAPSLLSAV